MPEISDLGIEASIRFAEDQQKLDPKYIIDPAIVRPNAEIDVTIPVYQSEYSQLFRIGTQISYATFEMPANFLNQKKRLFTTQLAPSLGPAELHESKIDKVRSVKIDQLPATNAYDFAWQAERERTDRETEQTKVLDMLETIHLFNRYLLEVKARIGQYKKG